MKCIVLKPSNIQGFLCNFKIEKDISISLHKKWSWTPCSDFNAFCKNALISTLYNFLLIKPFLMILFSWSFSKKTSMMLLLNCFSFSVNGLAASCTLVWRSVNVTKLLNDVSQMKSFFGCHHSYFFVSQDTIPVEF